MEKPIKLIIIWKDLTTGEIVRSKLDVRPSLSIISYLWGNNGRKLLYLFRVKKVKHGKMSIPQLLS
jgi:hypothetical protein